MNPYEELTRPEQEQHILEIEAEWLDSCCKASEVARWQQIIQEHRSLLLQAMEVRIFPIRLEDV